MNEHQDVPIGWRVFCFLLIVTPCTFLVLTWLVGETGTTKTLFPFTVAAIGWLFLWGRKRRSIVLHGVIGFLLVYQTYLLMSLPDVEKYIGNEIPRATLDPDLLVKIKIPPKPEFKGKGGPRRGGGNRGGNGGGGRRRRRN